MKKKCLSPIANDVLQKCAEILGTTVYALVVEFEQDFEPGTNDYARKLVEFCCSKALVNLCLYIDEKISDGSFSQLSFDMMLAWESPSSSNEDLYTESVAKEREDTKIFPKEVTGAQVDDDTLLFYSDILPLLVDEERHVGEDAFVWMCSLVPLAADVVNVRFAFEALTAATANRFHFPGYDKYIKEINKYINYLLSLQTPTGVELADDEYILHMEGSANAQRVVRHIGGTSWPGRLTLTNYALYFEASKIASYEKALRIDLSRQGVDHKVRPAATGPWGAPLFDRAIVYESSQLSEPLVLEFPEITSATRRDLWLTLIKEVILLHQFLYKFNIESPLKVWEMHARTILGVARLHVVRELLTISLPVLRNFLLFSLFDELPKGDYVLEELSTALKQMSTIHPCSASYILKRLNISHPILERTEHKKVLEETSGGPLENLPSLETTISQVREEAKEVGIAKATVEVIKEEGLGVNLLIFFELISPLKDVLSFWQEIITWERPIITLFVLTMMMVIIYKEWIGYAIAASLLWCVGKMIWARYKRVGEKYNEIVVCTCSDQTTIESIVNAQHGLKNFQEMLQTANITILKIRSILESRAPKHTNQVMLVLIAVAILLLVVPFKFILMATTSHYFLMNLKLRKFKSNYKGNRRLREWWESIPVTPVRVVDKTS
ncbi:argH (DUF639) [Tasmannia lanceolata]|uniref:argH (DUF639) n=1 Tax=Tasmannia lanceolata TaxID=3420 RepID=UPI0040635D0E